MGAASPDQRVPPSVHTAPAAKSSGGLPVAQVAAQGTSRVRHFGPRRIASWFVVALLLAGVGASVLPWWTLERAKSALRRRDTDSAAWWLNVGRRCGVSAATCEFYLGRVARRRSDLPAVEAHLKRAAALGWNPWEIEAEGWLVSAQAGLLSRVETRLPEILLRGDSDTVREACEAYVNAYTLNYRVLEAQELLKSWQADYPTDPLPYVYRGRLEEHGLQWELAVLSYRAALRVDPTFGLAHYNLARVELGQQHTEAALAHYRDAARCLRHPAAALIGQAHCLRKQRQFAEAKQLLERVIAEPLTEIQASCREVGDPLEVASVSAWAELGQVLQANGENERAVEMLEVALQRQPKNSGLRNLYAGALRSVGRLEDAYQESLVVQEAQRELAELTRLLERVKERDAEVASRTRLGELFLKHTSENQGLVWLNSALAIDPHYAPAHEILARHFESVDPPTPESKRLAAEHRRQAETGKVPADPAPSGQPATGDPVPAGQP